MNKILLPNTGQYKVTRRLPKTQQTTSYFVGDDGLYEGGWWKGKLNANNRVRWLSRTLSGDQIEIDRATGLMWPKDWSSNGGYNQNVLNWTGALIWADSLTFAGFTDWRLPNINEILSIVRYSGAAPLVDNIFNSVLSASFWSSTTYPITTTFAYQLSFATGVSGISPKIATWNVVAVRDSRL
jgi:hypothetical protein